MTYVVLYQDGRRRPFEPANGRKPALGELQSIVGGYVERVRVPGGELWVNEDGRSLGLRLNVTASQLAGQPIVGTVLLAMRKGAVLDTLLARATAEPAPGTTDAFRAALDGIVRRMGGGQ